MPGEVKNIKLKEILENALKKFYKEESENLLSMEGVERSCVFRIGMYMQDLMWHDKNKHYDELHLDCEYNKHLSKPKKVNNEIVIPDLILHKRKTDNNNAMVIEFKGFWNKDKKCDIEKLKSFTSRDKKNEYKYRLGAFVVLKKEQVKITYFEGGKKGKTETLLFK